MVFRTICGMAWQKSMSAKFGCARPLTGTPDLAALIVTFVTIKIAAVFKLRGPADFTPKSVIWAVANIVLILTPLRSDKTPDAPRIVPLGLSEIGTLIAAGMLTISLFYQ